MAPRLDRQTATIAMTDGALRLVAVADTHSTPHPAIAERLRALAPAAILHAGDIGELAVLEQLRAHAPLHAVRGNIDTRAHAVPDVLEIDIVDGDTTRLRILMLHVAVYGPRLRADVAKRAREARATLVVCGHSHVPFIGQERGITVFNPGSIGPRRFSLPICFGTIDIDPTRVRLGHVDCETGAAWLPPA
jgi:putative phosphoesterase